MNTIPKNSYTTTLQVVLAEADAARRQHLEDLRVSEAQAQTAQARAQELAAEVPANRGCA